MAYFLPGQIDRLDSQLDEYASAHSKAMQCFDVEELVSLFILLAAELEKSCKPELPGAERQAAITQFKHLVSVGGRIKGLVRQVREDGYSVKGADQFSWSLIRCRANAESDEILAERARVISGEIKTRPIQELIDELQRRDNAAGRRSVGAPSSADQSASTSTLH